MSRTARKKIFTLFVGCIIIIAVLILSIHKASGDQHLEVIFFDVGQGDSIFITTPSGQQILIDGGPDMAVLDRLGRNMPFYDHSIDFVVLTHAHSDHVAGLVEVLDRYDVGMILTSGAHSTSPDYLEWLRVIEEKNIPVTVASVGQEFTFDTVSMEVLYPLHDMSSIEIEDLNDSSVVSRLVYGDTSFLFTGDASAVVEEEIIASGTVILSDVLKVGHHGSKYSSSLEFVQAVDPQYAVIQVGEGNSFNHPHRLTLKRLEGLGIEVFRNDEVGDIEIRSDGSKVWVE